MIRTLIHEPRASLSALVYEVDGAVAFQPAYSRLAHAIGLERGAFLDVGCGPGWLAIHLASGRPELDAVGIDASPMMVALAERNKGTRLNVTFRQMSAAAIVFPDRTFDAAAVIHARDVWLQAPAVLDEIHRVLVPGGRAFIYEPDSQVSIPREWIHRRGPWPPDALLRRAWRRSSLDDAGWEGLKAQVKASPFGGGEEGRHGYFRRLLLKRSLGDR